MWAVPTQLCSQYGKCRAVEARVPYAVLVKAREMPGVGGEGVVWGAVRYVGSSDPTVLPIRNAPGVCGEGAVCSAC